MIFWMMSRRMENRRGPRSAAAIRPFILAAMVLMVDLLGGCIHQPQMLPLNRQRVIDRAVVEYPSGFVLKLIVTGLNCPSCLAIDDDGNILIAESGADGSEPHIFGYHPDGTYFNIYPYKRNVSFYPTGFVLYGPVGGMAATGGKIFVSHRDHDGQGVITALGYQGEHSTVIAGLPARGDYGVTDLAINPTNGRLFFGVGTATNSGVVGVDNWDEGWLKRYPDVLDELYSPPPGSNEIVYKLNGYRFDSPNPRAGLFGGSDIARTGPFQPFTVSNQTRIYGTTKPNGAVYSIPPDGGEWRVEAFGIHNPRGLAFNKYNLYMTNDGMQLRGTRPVMWDPDSLLQVQTDVFYGWPDYTTDGHPVSDPDYQPPASLLLPSGYSDLSFLIDHETSQLHAFGGRPELFLAGRFPTLAGASKFSFAPDTGPFKEYADNAIVTLFGDQAPFVTGNYKNFHGPVGHKIVRVDMDTKQVRDFIRNTAGVPASMQNFGAIALERPIDVKFRPDHNAMYILDFGEEENKTGIPRYYNGSGKLFILVPETKPAATRGDLEK
jgi:hypothetical protein